MTTGLATLPNGLRIVTDRIDTVDTVSLGLWVDVGTRHEAPDINGVAHFLEHMAFKGTERRSARAIAEEIEAVGGHLNAYTSRESTAYYAKVLKEDLPLALDILADILLHSTFDPAELERERTVILQEIGQANDTPDDIIFDYFQERAFPDQAMGRPVLGTPEIIGRLSREAVVEYLRGHYSASRIVLSASGNLDHDRVVALAEKLLSDLPAELPVTTEPARYVGGDHREERDLEQLHLVLGFPGIPLGDPDYYAAAVLSTAFGGGMSSRLFQEVRENRGLVYAIHSFAHSYRDGGLFGIYAGTGEEEAAELVPVLCDEAMRLEDGLAPGELARAKAQMKAGLLMSLESTGARCEQMAQHMLVHGTPFDPADIVRQSRRWTPPRSPALSAAGAARRRPWPRSGRSAGSRISSASAPGSAPDPDAPGRNDGSELPAPVSGSIGAAAAGRRAGVPAPARARRLRGLGQSARPLARLSRAVGADLAAGRAEPVELPRRGCPATPRTGAPIRATISLSSATRTRRWPAASDCRTCAAASPRRRASDTGSASRSRGSAT